MAAGPLAGCWALRGRSRRGGVHRHRSRSLCERTTVPSYVCCLARCTPFRNFCTFCQSFAVLHSICERRVGRTVCTWMSCTMSGNFDFYSPFIIRRLAPRAKCWRRLLFVFCRIFLCLSYIPLFFSCICSPPLSHSNHTVWKVFAHFVYFVSFCTQQIQSIPFFRTPWKDQKHHFAFGVLTCTFVSLCWLFFLYRYLCSIYLLSVLKVFCRHVLCSVCLAYICSGDKFFFCRHVLCSVCRTRSINSGRRHPSKLGAHCHPFQLNPNPTFNAFQ